MLQVQGRKELRRIYQHKVFSGNVYKVVPTERRNEFGFACSDGLFFAKFDERRSEFILDESANLFDGKYVT